MTALLSVGLLANAAETEIASIEFKKSSDQYENVSAYNKNWRTTDGKWNINCFNNNNRGWDFIASGWKTAATAPYIATGVAYAEEVTKIVITIGDRFTAAAIVNPTLYIADDADFSVNATTTAIAAPTGAKTDWVIEIATPASDKYYKVGFDCDKQSANGQAMSVTKVAIFADSSKADPEYGFSAATAIANLGDAFTAPVFTKADNAPEPIFSSSEETVATVDSKTGVVSIVAAGETTITAESEGDEQYLSGRASYVLTVIDGKTFYKATAIKSGSKYLIVANGKVAKPRTDNYGYLNVTDAIVDGENIKAEEENAFTFTTTEGGYTIQQSDDRYMYQTGTYNSFNLSETMPEEGGVWTVSFGTDGVTITNVAMNKYVQFSTGYNSFGCYADAQDGGVLPMLYSTEMTGVDAIVAEDGDAPVEYFNLQGVRVSEPSNGLFIRRQGNTVSKVIVK